MTDLSNAFGISKDDVENVLNAARRWEKTILPARANLARRIAQISVAGMAARVDLVPSLSLSELAGALFDRIDHNAVAAAALNAGNEIDEQTDGAYIEIERQLNEMDPRILTHGYLPGDAEQQVAVVSPDARRGAAEHGTAAATDFSSDPKPEQARLDRIDRLFPFTSKVVDAVVEMLGKDDLAMALNFRLSHKLISDAAFDAGPEMGAQESAALREIWKQLGPVSIPLPTVDQVLASHLTHVSDKEVEAGFRAEAQVAKVLSGVHPVCAGYDDTPFIGCPDSFGEKNFANIVWFEDRGDPSVGVPPRSGWTLGPDQTGTVVSDLAKMQRQIEAGVGLPFETGCPPFDPRYVNRLSGRADSNVSFLGMNERAAVWMLENFEGVIQRAIAHGATESSKNVERMRTALSAAESFLAGFEGDETQEGIDELIEEVREAQRISTAPKTLLEKAADSADRALHTSLASAYEQLERAGVFTGLSETALKAVYTLRLVAAKADPDLLASEAKAAATFWRSKLDELNPPDDDAQSPRRVDTPRT